MKCLIRLSLVVFMSLVLIGCGNKEVVDNISNDNQAIILEDQIINGLSFESFNIITDSDNITHIYFEIANNTENNISVEKVILNLYSNEEQVLSLPIIVSKNFEYNDRLTIQKNIDIKLQDIDKVEYIIE